MGAGSQSDHDQASFGESLSEPTDYNPVLLDCGHWWAEDEGELVGDKVVCPNCAEGRHRTEAHCNGRAGSQTDG
jgi:hypothetical protein